MLTNSPLSLCTLIMMSAAGPDAAAKPAMDTETKRDITDLVAKTECFCLNHSDTSSWENLFIGDDRLGLQSDADEQLLIHVAFNERVNLSALKFTGFNTTAFDAETAPSKISLYVNRENMGFSDCEDIEPTQELEFDAAEMSNVDGVEKALKFVKFQRVNSVSEASKQEGTSNAQDLIYMESERDDI